jgi:hypothetical protein
LSGLGVCGILADGGKQWRQNRGSFHAHQNFRKNYFGRGDCRDVDVADIRGEDDDTSALRQPAATLHRHVRQEPLVQGLHLQLQSSGRIAVPVQ